MKRFAPALALLALLICAPLAHAAPTCVAGAQGTAPTATLSFLAPTTNTDSTPIATPLSYELFQGTAPGGETLAASGIVASPITVNTGITDGTTVYWYLVVKDAHGTLSANSNEVCKSFPLGVPATVTITIT